MPRVPEVPQIVDGHAIFHSVSILNFCACLGLLCVGHCRYEDKPPNSLMTLTLTHKALTLVLIHNRYGDKPPNSRDSPLGTAGEEEDVFVERKVCPRALFITPIRIQSL